MRMMGRDFPGKQEMEVSVCYTELGTREDFVVEGSVVAHFIKRWDPDFEEERCLLSFWEANEPLKRTHSDGTIDYVEADDLCPMAKDEITCLICRVLAA